MIKEIIDFKYRDEGCDGLVHLEHSHSDCYEILFVHRGAGSITVRDRFYPILSDTLYFINGSETHCSRPDSAPEYVRSKLVVDAHFVDSLGALVGGVDSVTRLFHTIGGACYHLTAENAQVLKDAFLALERVQKDDHTAMKMCLGSVILTLLRLSLFFGDARVEDITDGFVASILKYINENLDKELAIDGICQRFHISRSYLLHRFKKEVGVTVVSYITSRRIDIAKELLRYTEQQITEIAMQCGFSELSYFGKVFRANTGKRPLEYRREYKAKR